MAVSPSHICLHWAQSPCLGQMQVQPDADIAGIGASQTLSQDRMSKEADPGANKFQVLLSFVISAGCAILLACVAYFCRLLPSSVLTDFDRLFFKPRTPITDDWRTTLEKAAMVISDTQLITGIALLIAGFSKLVGLPGVSSSNDQGISVYHWHVITYLAWMASNVHLTTLTFLRPSMQANSLLRALRVSGMLVLASLLFAALLPTLSLEWSAALTNELNPAQSESCETSYTLALPAQCFWNFTAVDQSRELYSIAQGLGRKDFIRNLCGFNPDVLLSIVFLLVSYAWKIAGLCGFSGAGPLAFVRWVVLRPYEVMLRRLLLKHQSCKDRILRAMLWLPQSLLRTTYLVTLACILLFESFAGALWIQSIALAWAIFQLVQAKALLPANIAASENLWNFGQILPMLLLALPIMSMGEHFMLVSATRRKPLYSYDVFLEQGLDHKISDMKFLVVAQRRSFEATQNEKITPAWPGSMREQDLSISELIQQIDSEDAETLASLYCEIYGSSTFKLMLVLANLVLLCGAFLVFALIANDPGELWCHVPVYGAAAICSMWLVCLMSSSWSRLHR